MYSPCTLMRPETFLGCDGFGVYGSAATPQRKSGLVGKLLIRSIPILPVKKADWPGDERKVFNSSLVGTTWRRWNTSAHHCSPLRKPGVSMVTFLVARSNGP